MQGRWTVKDAVLQIKKCEFTCEGGPLECNEAFIWMVGKLSYYENLQGPSDLPAVEVGEAEPTDVKIIDKNTELARILYPDKRWGSMHKDCTGKWYCHEPVFTTPEGRMLLLSEMRKRRGWPKFCEQIGYYESADPGAGILNIYEAIDVYHLLDDPTSLRDEALKFLGWKDPHES